MKIKNRRIAGGLYVVVALLIGLTASAGPVRAQTISVTGQATVTAAPDLAMVSVGVTASAREADAAVEAMGDQIGAVLGALTDAGVDAADLATQTVRLNPSFANRNNSLNEGPEITGFIAATTIEVTLRDVTALGGVLDAAVMAGANRIDAIRFDLSDPTDLIDTARAMAVRDAAHRAAVYAEAAGVGVGDVVSISEQGGFAPQPVFEAALSASGARVPVIPGDWNYTAEVFVIYEISRGE